MSDHTRDMDELLGAYALDAVSDQEHAVIEQYLSINPKARAEVREHREVAAMLAWTGTMAPDGLWDRISARLEEQAPPPSGELAAVLSLAAARDLAPAASPSDSAQTRRLGRHRSVGRTIGSWLVGSAAAALVAVFVVTVMQRDDVARSALASAAQSALDDRTSATATLVDEAGTVGGRAVIDHDGHGYLIVSGLPSLPLDHTYQLWGVIEGKVISLGVLGHHPEIATFSADGTVTQLVVTNEVGGGVIMDGNPDGAFAGTLG